MAGLTTTNIAATTAAVANRLVASALMKVGAYTVANSGQAVWQGAFKVTVTHTADGTVDTLGTIAIVGKGLHGEAVTESITPLDGTVATGTKYYKSVTSVTGAGWIIAVGNDTITVGVAADSYAALGGGIIDKVIVDVAAAATVVLSDSSGTLATYPASLSVGTYDLGIPFSGFLKIATTSTNGIRVIHSPGVPNSYVLS